MKNVHENEKMCAALKTIICTGGEEDKKPGGKTRVEMWKVWG